MWDQINILYFILLLHFSQGYQYMTEISTHPDYLEQCFSNDNNKTYWVGESFFKVGVCERFTCLDDFRFGVTGCAPTTNILPDNCKTVKPDVSLDFPKCCFTKECIDADGNKYRL